jgi:hypothetical protein
MNKGFILARRVSEMQQLNCKHYVCPYPRKGIHVSCLMTPSQAPFIALSILGNVLFMPQSKFIDSLLDQCVATLSTHGLCAVIQADSKPPFLLKKVGASEACYMNLVHERDLDADSQLSVTSQESNQSSGLQFHNKYALMSNQLKHEQMYL